MPPVIKNQQLKKVIKSFKDRFPKTRFLWAMSAFLTGRSAYHQLGWFKSSWKLNSVNAKGEPIPWITYPAIDFLDKKLAANKKISVWEYGSGNSTLWWAQRAGSIHAVEHHKGWYDHIKTALGEYDNAKISFCELGDEYPRAIKQSNKLYDCVVIDGRMRVASSEAALEKLSKQGVIIWDNSDRPYYEPGIGKLQRAGFKRIDFVGIVPIGNYLAQTTVFYRTDNVFEI